MLMVWAHRIEDSLWIKSKEVKDEEEAIRVMIAKDVWIDQMMLVEGDFINILPTGWYSDFGRKANAAWQRMCTESEEEHDRKEYKRLKLKYEGKS